MQEKPLVSFCLFSYNQEKFIKEALDGALNQTYSPLEIIISDDCSTDNTFEIIKEEIKNYKGPHKIIINKNHVNLGLSSHVNKILYDMSSGVYVALAAGDDISLPKRIEVTMDFINKSNEPIMCLSSQIQIINEDSKLMENGKDIKEDFIYDFNYYISDEYRHINGPSRVISRVLIDAFPKLNSKCPTEDTTFLLRAFIIGKVAFISEKLIKYRIHNSNLSSSENIKKMSIEEIFSQNKRDLDFGLENKYISNKTYKKILSKNIKIKNSRMGIKKHSILFRLKNKIVFFLKTK